MSTAALLGRLRIDFEVQTGKLQAGMNQANKSIDSMSKRLINLNNVMLGVAGAAGLGQLVGGMINATNKTIAWEAGMLAATGTLGAAKLEMQFVRRVADDMGIGLSRSADEFVKLANSAKGTALEGQVVRDLFEQVSLAGRVFNLTADDMGGSFRAITQSLSKGVLSMEEWRQQFSERIPGAMKAGADAMELTVEAFSELISSGQLMSAEFFPKLIPQLEKMTKAGAEMAKQSPAAQFTRLSNAVFDLGQAIGSSGVVGFLAEIAMGITDVVKAVSGNIGGIVTFSRNVAILGASLAGAFVAGKIVAGIKAATAALGGFNLMFSITVGRVGVGLAAIGTALNVATVAAKRFWLAIGGPVGAAVLAAGGIWAYVAAQKANKEAIEAATKAHKELADAARSGHDLSVKAAKAALDEAAAKLKLAEAELVLLEAQEKRTSDQSMTILTGELEDEDLLRQREEIARLTTVINLYTDALKEGEGVQAAVNRGMKAGEAAAQALAEQKARLEAETKAWAATLQDANSKLKFLTAASRNAELGVGELHKEVDETGEVLRRFKNDVIDEADAHTNAATAIEIHVTAMERLAAATSGAAREASGLVGNLNGILTSFGGSFPQGGQIASQFSAVSNLSGLFGSSNLAGGLSDLLTSAGTEGAKSGFLSGRTAGFLNEAAGNLRGTSDAAIGLSGAAGGIAATAAFGSGGYVGTGASIGGLLGAVLGSFSPLGPAGGAAAGSFIGGGIGSLFGSNQDKPKVAIQSLPFGTGPDGTFGQRSFIGTTPFSQIMAGGRDGAGLSDSMIALVTGIQQMDTTLAEFMSPEQIARAQQAAQGIGGIETRADRFSAGPVIFQRAEALIKAAGGDLLKLFEKFKPSEQSLKAFIDSLGILTEMGQSATEIAASFDMANEGFRELIAMVAGFEEFTGTTLQDVQDSLDFLNQTPMMAFDSATTALFEAMEAFDGTEEATRRLNASLGAFAKTEIAVLQDLNRLRESTASSIASTVQTVRFLGMTPEQIWEESRVGANALLAGIQNGTITDPQAVAAASQQALGFFNTGFGTLSGEQQLAQRGDALAFLEALNVASSDAYAVAEEKIAQIHIDATTQMTTSLDRAARAIIDAAARLQAPPAPVIEVQYTDTVFVPGDGGKEVNA